MCARAAIKVQGIGWVNCPRQALGVFGHSVTCLRLPWQCSENPGASPATASVQVLKLNCILMTLGKNMKWIKKKKSHQRLALKWEFVFFFIWTVVRRQHLLTFWCLSLCVSVSFSLKCSWFLPHQSFSFRHICHDGTRHHQRSLWCFRNGGRRFLN